MRADDAADHVERVLDTLGPNPKRFVGCVLERLRAAGHRVYVRPEQLHDEHVERLALDVDGAHVHVGRKTKLGRHRRGRNAVLPGAGLGDQTLLAHASRQERLTHGVVDLVRAGVVRIFPLNRQRYVRHVAQVTLGSVERRRPPDEIAQDGVVLAPERSVRKCGRHFAVQLVERRDQHFGNEAAAECAEVAAGVRLHRRPERR